MTSRPKVILRLGSHAEKEYLEKLANSLDGFIFGANLLEITPAATTSLIFSLKTRRAGRAIPFFIDPMTYCFGPYVDLATNRTRIDLDVLKSKRSESRGSKKKIYAVKDSYMSLAQELGPLFGAAVSDGETCRAVDLSKVGSAVRQSMCEGVVSYQIQRIGKILSSDGFLEHALADGAQPAAVFAPYFFIHEAWSAKGLDNALELVERTVALSPPVPVHAMICASASLLVKEEFVDKLASGLIDAAPSGVWLWFDGFDEHKASVQQLVAFRSLVSRLSGRMEIYNAHGGYFSLLLAHDGLTGISHGVGYGEKKAVIQVQGAAAPTVRYYLPPIRFRVGVPDVQRCFKELNIRDSVDFYERVCGCQICRGVIGRDLNKFRAFGDQHRANSESKKDTQTPAAAKICRFHFLINRLKEPAAIADLIADARSDHVTSTAAGWRECEPLSQYLGSAQSGDGFIERWSAALEGN